MTITTDGEQIVRGVFSSMTSILLVVYVEVHKADIASRRAEERRGKAYDNLRNLVALADASVKLDSSRLSGIRQESLPLIS
jgi:hypothetical protein